MAPKGSAKKGTATRRRRERKNIERGAAHIPIHLQQYYRYHQ